MKRLIVIISDDCPYCHRLTEELNRRNVEYELINISSEPEKVQALGVGIYGLPASIVKDENNIIWAYRAGFSHKLVKEILAELKTP